MGDRISVSFQNTGWNGEPEESIVLFHHWGGKEFVQTVMDYIQELDKEVPKKECYPLERREPNTVMLDFIRWLFKDQVEERIMGSLYLAKTQNDGDNSDNGHWCWDLNEGRWRK